eukprot:TRINITY_DN58489_c0_g1_i1.p1 TRINITY_DN58489_c0_g1~~TRINITY_DN58489_c0_g1_i1.p1  ORF type:complete len:397 (+),score=68.90 TRINITY_DN58489_c0_g1_i1:79-1191(+)
MAASLDNQQSAMSGKAKCRIGGNFFRQLYDIHLINDILLVGSNPSDPDHVEFLDGALVTQATREVTVQKPQERPLVMIMQSIDDARQWSVALAQASRLASNIRQGMRRAATNAPEMSSRSIDNEPASVTQKSEKHAGHAICGNELGVHDQQVGVVSEEVLTLRRMLEVSAREISELKEERRKFVVAAADRMQRDGKAFRANANAADELRASRTENEALRKQLQSAIVGDDVRAIREENVSLRVQLQAATAALEARAGSPSAVSLEAFEALKKENALLRAAAQDRLFQAVAAERQRREKDAAYPRSQEALISPKHIPHVQKWNDASGAMSKDQILPVGKILAKKCVADGKEQVEEEKQASRLKVNTSDENA